MRSRRMLLWKMILSAAASKQRKALSGPFAGVEASLPEMSYPPGGLWARVLRMGGIFYESTGALHSTSENAQPGIPAKILAFMLAPLGRPVMEMK